MIRIVLAVPGTAPILIILQILAILLLTCLPWKVGTREAVASTVAFRIRRSNFLVTPAKAGVQKMLLDSGPVSSTG